MAKAKQKVQQFVTERTIRQHKTASTPNSLQETGIALAASISLGPKTNRQGNDSFLGGPTPHSRKHIFLAGLSKPPRKYGCFLGGFQPPPRK